MIWGSTVRPAPGAVEELPFAAAADAELAATEVRDREILARIIIHLNGYCDSGGGAAAATIGNGVSERIFVGEPRRRCVEHPAVAHRKGASVRAAAAYSDDQRIEVGIAVISYQRRELHLYALSRIAFNRIGACDWRRVDDLIGRECVRATNEVHVAGILSDDRVRAER